MLGIASNVLLAEARSSLRAASTCVYDPQLTMYSAQPVVRKQAMELLCQVTGLKLDWLGPSMEQQQSIGCTVAERLCD